MSEAVSEVARIYSDVNQSKPPSYYNYEALDPTWNDPQRYELVAKLGQGKYSDVFSGVDTETNERCVIKVLKPVRPSKFQREISILQNLLGGTNIVRLLDTVRNANTNTPSLVTSYVDNTDYRTLYPQFTLYDVAYYSYKILQALDYCHSRGIMHRDLKPQNIMINHSTRELALIDWGLAEYYHPKKEYHVRVASRHYKGPELLVEYQKYDYSLDLWSFGCTFAGMIFRTDVFFNGKDNSDQLVKIVKILGSEDYEKYIRKYGIKFKQSVPNSRKVPLSKFIQESNRHLATPAALDLLEKLLKYDHSERLTAKEAMEHPFFDFVRNDIPDGFTVSTISE